jgi:hypothetical protein
MIVDVNNFDSRAINKNENSAIFFVETKGVNLEALGFKRLSV